MVFLIIDINKILGTEKVNTSAYHPQTDGLTERFNRTLMDIISFALFAYQTAIQTSTKEMPFYLMYGRKITDSK